VRECESARVRECESARVRECESAEVRRCGGAGVRECGSAGVRECGANDPSSADAEEGFSMSHPRMSFRVGPATPEPRPQPCLAGPRGIYPAPPTSLLPAPRPARRDPAPRSVRFRGRSQSRRYGRRPRASACFALNSGGCTPRGAGLRGCRLWSVGRASLGPRLDSSGARRELVGTRLQCLGLRSE
jgi:hypothetical protein